MRARPSVGARGRRFTLELPVDTPDGFGGVLTSYQPGPQVWGALEFLTSVQRTEAGLAADLATHRLTLAWRDDVTPATRLSLGPRRFLVRHAGDPDGARRSLVCLVQEVSS